MPVDYNPFDPATIEDPYPVYAALREQSPVHLMENFPFWALSRYDDVAAALRDPAIFSSRKGMGELFDQALGADLTMARSEGRNILASDPPIHTRLRRIVSRGFTPQVVRTWEDAVRDIANDLIDQLLADAKHGPVDLASGLFAPLPPTVIARVLGIEAERRTEFKEWSEDLLTGLSLFADKAKVAAAAQALNSYFDGIVAERQGCAGDDLVSMLVNKGTEGEEPLSFDEMVGFATILLVGGTETTSNFLGNWFSAVTGQPGLLEDIRADADVLNQSIEEGVRFDTPTQMVWRGVVEDTEINGVAVPEGAQVAILLGSANRDEDRFGPDASEYRVGRDTSGHVGFGFGPHTCLGSHFAKLEARVTIETLLGRTLSIEPSGPAVRGTSFMLRGFASVPVTIKEEQ